MADRLGLQERSQLCVEQQELYDAFISYTRSKYDGMYVSHRGRFTESRFKSRDDLGRLLGPFGILLHTPTVAKAYIPMIGAITRIHKLDAGVRETAILVVGSRTGAKYET
jgi:4-carboxymuconolactone decarboxylase